uniref:FlgD/Vpr Ig-like domain-containing protein n=1 Tax=candidate division WOR-3 bacterium TaxID=2052148 RepID=A0A7V1EHZ5_UNCW3
MINPITLIIINLAISIFGLTPGQETIIFENEFLIDKNFFYRPKAGFQSFSSVAFDGINYLIVWQDGAGLTDIYGTRLTSEGVIIDSIGIPISNAPRYQNSPEVLFDGDKYFIVWEDYRSGGIPIIYGCRLNPDGTVLDTGGIIISLTYSCAPHLAFDGTNYLVVWEDQRSGYFYTDIYGARVTQSGMVLDPGGFPISIAGYGQSSPRVTFGGTNYLVVWADGRNGQNPDIYGARVSTAGIVIDTVGIIISNAPGTQVYPTIVYGNNEYLIAWRDSRNGNADIYASRVTPDGIVLDTLGIPVDTTVSAQSQPALYFDGTNFLVVWRDYRDGANYDIYGVRINPSGNILDTAFIPIATGINHETNPAVSFDTTNYIVTFTNEAEQNVDIMGVRISKSGVIIDTSAILISTGVYFYSQSSPALSFCGQNYFAVWEDERNGNANCDIFGARITCSGLVLDSAGIPISVATNDQKNPAVIFDGTNYFVVWQDKRINGLNYDIFGARINSQGIVLDTLGIPISVADNDQKNPSVAIDGTNYFVVWEDNRINQYNYDIYGARVTPEGIVLDTGGIAIDEAQEYQINPRVIFGTTNYFVVWEDYRNDIGEIYGCRVDQNGAVIDTGGIAILPSPNFRCNPAVAFDGNNYLVLWQESRPSTYWDIYGTRVTQTGLVIDSTGIAISTAPNSQWLPAISFNGTSYFTAWQDLRNWSSWDIYGARVTTSGMVSGSFNVSTQIGNQHSPAILALGDSALVLYSGWCDSILGFPANVMRIWGKMLVDAGVAENRLIPKAIETQISLFPNPFRNLLKIGVRAGKYGRYRLEIFNVLGQKIKTIFNEERQSGYYELIWDGRDDRNRQMPAGVYYVLYQMDDSKTTAKIVLLK